MSFDFDDVDIELGEARPRTGETEPVIFVRRDAFDSMVSHAAEDLEKEVGGVMLGSGSSSDEGTHVLIEAVIPALHTEAGRGRITFTHDTFEYINEIKDQEYPEMRIVGWYHSHPGFGIFLSDHDEFIQRCFFEAPWQVAFVVDPRAGQNGMFVWCGGELGGPTAYEIIQASDYSGGRKRAEQRVDREKSGVERAAEDAEGGEAVPVGEPEQGRLVEAEVASAGEGAERAAEGRPVEPEAAQEPAREEPPEVAEPAAREAERQAETVSPLVSWLLVIGMAVVLGLVALTAVKSIEAADQIKQVEAQVRTVQEQMDDLQRRVDNLEEQQSEQVKNRRWYTVVSGDYMYRVKNPAAESGGGGGH